MLIIQNNEKVLNLAAHMWAILKGLLLDLNKRFFRIFPGYSLTKTKLAKILAGMSGNLSG